MRKQLMNMTVNGWSVMWDDVARRSSKRCLIQIECLGAIGHGRASFRVNDVPISAGELPIMSVPNLSALRALHSVPACSACAAALTVREGLKDAIKLKQLITDRRECNER